MMTHYAKSETGIDMREAKEHIAFIRSDIPKRSEVKKYLSCFFFFFR